MKEADEPWLMTWGSVLGVWLAFMLFTGGLSTPSALATTAHFTVGAALLVAALWRLRLGFPNKFAVCGWLLFFAGFLLVCAQLVPLPPSIWQTLPGRTLIRDTLVLTGDELPWLPLSLTPKETAVTVVSLIAILAGFLAALTFKSYDFLAFALILMGTVLVAVVVGLLQVSGRAPDALYFYGKTNPLSATGFFGNRNFLGALIFSSLPFLAVVATAIQCRFRVYPAAIISFILIYIAIMLGGLAVVGSRAGILLAMPSVFLTLLFVYKAPHNTSTLKRSGFATVAVVGTLLIISQASMLGILRLLKSDPLEDIRTTIYAVSMTTAKAFWPVGSGFGSFVKVYQMHDQPSAIVESYVNAAHNDWLQFGLEGGAPAVLLIACFVLMFLFALFNASRFNRVADEHSTTVRAALLCVLLLSAHAAVDFGLRTPALLSLFAVASGLACLTGRTDQHTWKPSSRQPKPSADSSPAPTRVSRRDPAKPYFKVSDPK